MIVHFTTIIMKFGTTTVLYVFLLFASSAQAQNVVNCNKEIIGTWISSANSTITITSSKPGEITGTFKRGEKGSAPIRGNYSKTATNGNCPLSFIANWPKSGSYYATVTSYTGMYQSSNGKIRTVFLLVNPKKPGYESVSVSTDFFHKK